MVLYVNYSTTQHKNIWAELEELRSIFLQLPELIEDQELEEMLRAGDRNGDGKFDLEDLG